jgi:hypothetical protein
MQQLTRKLEPIFYNYKVIPLILCLSIIIDYTLTFYVAGTPENVLRFDNSPLLKLAVENNLVIEYLAIVVIFYYLAGYMALKLFNGHIIYSAGVAIFLLLSLTHVLGGLSWLVINVYYSYFVIGLSISIIFIAIGILCYLLYEKLRSGHNKAISV